MTQRGLIIGASHAAALRLGWRQCAATFPDLDLSFAALHGEGLADLVLDGPILTAKSPGVRENLKRLSGADSFDLKAFDFLGFCGGTAGPFHAIQLYNRYRWPALPSLGTADLSRDLPISLLSAACFEQALAGQFMKGPAWPLIRRIAETAGPRCFAIPHPLVSYDACEAGPKYLGFLQLHRNGDAEAMAAMLDSAGRHACAGLATYVPPPPRVRKHHFFTHPAFRRGATRLGATDSEPQPEDDFLHGNADYGTHILAALFAEL